LSLENRILFRVENYAYYTILLGNNKQQELSRNLRKEGNGGRSPRFLMDSVEKVQGLAGLAQGGETAGQVSGVE